MNNENENTNAEVMSEEQSNTNSSIGSRGGAEPMFTNENANAEVVNEGQSNNKAKGQERRAMTVRQKQLAETVEKLGELVRREVMENVGNDRRAIALVLASDKVSAALDMLEDANWRADDGPELDVEQVDEEDNEGRFTSREWQVADGFVGEMIARRVRTNGYEDRADILEIYKDLREFLDSVINTHTDIIEMAQEDQDAVLDALKDADELTRIVAKRLTRCGTLYDLDLLRDIAGNGIEASVANGDIDAEDVEDVRLVIAALAAVRS